MNRQMSSSRMELFIPSTNHEDYDRSRLLSREMDTIFNQSVENCYRDLKYFSFIRPLNGDARRYYGDYVCFSVLEVCEHLRKKDPDLFDKIKPKQIAEKIRDGLQSPGIDKNMMINQESVQLQAAGILTFKLHGSWIAQRIRKMLINGIDTWAPIIFKRRARAAFLSLTSTPDMTLNTLRAECIKQALVRIFLYSGIDVRDNSSSYGDLDSIRYEVCELKADIIVHVNPAPLREYIQEFFAVAGRQKWLGAAQLTCCGYQTFSSDQEEKLGSELRKIYSFHLSPGSPLFDMAKYAGYTVEEFFDCIVKYSWLKSHRLFEFTFGIEEMLHREGNSFVYVLSTRGLIWSIINNPGILFKEEEALAGNGERELGLHLVEFTGAIEKACQALVPNIVCEYLFDLCKLFNSYHREVWHGPKVGLCRATEVVMAKCFDLLDISWGSCSIGCMNLLDRVKETRPNYRLEDLACMNRYWVKETRETDNRIIHSPSEASYLRSRFELFTMDVSVSDPDFDEGSIFGKLEVKDALGARADGWTRTDAKDSCYISCFNHEWYEPLDISYDSLIPFGDPSCRRFFPVSSSVEVDLLLHAMSKSKDQCYLVFHGKRNVSLSKFWKEEPKTKCGTLEFESDIGRVLVNFILLKEVVDASMEVTFRLPNPDDPIVICGTIMAFYGGNVVKDDLQGQYKATIFRTKHFKLIGNQVVLPLHRSLLAVPADGRLKIEALLMDVESQKTYVNETRNYRVRPGKTSDLYIECENFHFNIKVTWIK